MQKTVFELHLFVYV